MADAHTVRVGYIESADAVLGDEYDQMQRSQHVKRRWVWVRRRETARYL
ncbi:hypothetical protein WN943_010701 [Citrus x changshan-huyou]